MSIRDLALKIKNILGFKGEIWFNANKPDGMPMKALYSTTLLKMGWSPTTSLDDALCETYEWFKTKCNISARSRKLLSIKKMMVSEFH